MAWCGIKLLMHDVAPCATNCHTQGPLLAAISAAATVHEEFRGGRKKPLAGTGLNFAFVIEGEVIVMPQTGTRMSVSEPVQQETDCPPFPHARSFACGRVSMAPGALTRR